VTDRAVDELFGIQQGRLPIAVGREYVGHVLLAGRGSVKAILIWGDLPSERDTITIRLNQENYGRYPLRFQSGRTTADGVFAVGLESTGSAWIGAVSLMPADNVEGFKAEVLGPLKELGTPIYRWPGGMFASGYDWRDGIGPGDRRPPRRQRGSAGLESNDFGIDEFLTLCRLLDTEPLVVVNMGLGSPELAAALVQYCNGSAQTAWGRRRAANGRPEPYGVTWWGVGNGTYEDRQAGYVPLDPYLDRHSEFAEAMRAVDPKVKLVGVGRTGLWSEQMLERCGAMMDALGETVFIREHSELEEHVAAVPNAIRAKALAHRRYLESVSGLGDRTIPMALQNWGYRAASTEDAAAGAGPTLRDSLGIARGLHEMVRHAELMRMAHHTRIVHTGSAIPTLRMVTAFAATDLPFILYRHQFGTLGLRVTGRSVPLDVVAALTSDRRQATIGIVNPTTNSVQLELAVSGGALGTQATRYLISGDDPMAFNEHGQSLVVAIRESVVAEFDPKQILAPPLSVSLYVVSVRR
jgi:alpha-N-arabinofuranosidase